MQVRNIVKEPRKQKQEQTKSKEKMEIKSEIMGPLKRGKVARKGWL